LNRFSLFLVWIRRITPSTWKTAKYTAQ